MPPELLNRIERAAEIWRHNHLLTTEGISAEEITALFDVADYFTESGISGNNRFDLLKGTTVVSAFFETSTRTKVSFELAARRLGADVAGFQATTSSISKGESLLDTLATIDAMGTDFWVVRHPQSGAVELMSRHSSCSFINAGDGRHQHPTQGLLDCYSLHRRWNGYFHGKKVCIAGDVEHSRVARSNIPLLKTLGCHTAIVAPGTLCPHGWQTFGVERFASVDIACEKADALIVLRLQNERMEGGLLPRSGEFTRYYGMTAAKLRAYPQLTVLHPGPVNYGVELDAETSASNRSLIRQQVTNGVAIRMAVLAILAAKRHGTHPVSASKPDILCG